MLYLLTGSTLGRWGRDGSGVGPCVRSLVCVATSSFVEVPGVVDGDVDSTCDELKVEADSRCERRLPFCLFAWPFSPCDVVALLLFLRRLKLRKEGISARPMLERRAIYNLMGAKKVQWALADKLKAALYRGRVMQRDVHGRMRVQERVESVNGSKYTLAMLGGGKRMKAEDATL